MNRRTFGKIVAGLFAMPLGFLGKAEAAVKIKPYRHKWRRWGKIETPIVPLVEGVAPYNPYQPSRGIAWRRSGYRAIILNDDFGHILTVES
jgi:hypothetical protein